MKVAPLFKPCPECKEMVEVPVRVEPMGSSRYGEITLIVDVDLHKVWSHICWKETNGQMADS